MKSLVGFVWRSKRPQLYDFCVKVARPLRLLRTQQDLKLLLSNRIYQFAPWRLGWDVQRDYLCPRNRCV